MTRRYAAVGLVVSVILAAATACTSSGGEPRKSPAPTSSQTVTSPSSPLTTPKSTEPPEAGAAKSAYLAYTAATYAAERTPQKKHVELALLAVDPALGTVQGLLTNLQIAGIANRGTPPSARVKITKTDLRAKPWPTVSLIDCPTVSSSWVAYDVKTGKPVKVVPNPVKPPYAISASVIQYKGKWVVHQTKADRSHTCAPSPG